MSRIDRNSIPNGEAVVEFLDGDIRIIRSGRFVTCAVTHQPIPLDELKYWSVEKQQAYATREAVLSAMGRGPDHSHSA
jgi:hypothetical protein